MCGPPASLASFTRGIHYLLTPTRSTFLAGLSPVAPLSRRLGRDAAAAGLPRLLEGGRRPQADAVSPLPLRCSTARARGCPRTRRGEPCSGQAAPPRPPFRGAGASPRAGGRWLPAAASPLPPPRGGAAPVHPRHAASRRPRAAAAAAEPGAVPPPAAAVGRWAGAGRRHRQSLPLGRRAPGAAEVEEPAPAAASP